MNEGERFQRAFEDAAIGIALLAVEPLGKYLEVNPAFCRMTGYSRDELLARDFQSITASQDVGKNLEQLHALLTGTVPFLQLEKQYIRKNTSAFWTRLNVSLVRNDRGIPQYFIVQIENTDEHKRAEEALRESEARLRAIFDHEPECVKLVDRDGNLLDMNPAGLRIIEADSLAQVEGLCIYPLVAEEYREVYRRLHERVLHGESGSLVFDIISLKGTRRTIETHETPLLDPSGTVVAALGITRDITERKRAEEALRESEAMFRALSDATFDGITIYEEGRILEANQSFARMFGYTPAEVIGKSASEFTTPESYELIMKNIKAGHERPYEIIGLKKDGTVFNIEVIGKNCQYHGRTVRVTALRDITERKRLEEQLQHAQKLEAVGQLAGGVAHEFNNMLTAIIGNLDLAIGQIPPESDQHSTLTGALQAARRAAMLTQQLLTFSHRSPMDPQPQDLGSIASEIVNLLRQTIDRRIQVSVQAGDGLWPVLADAGQMHQVIMNLCVNARDALVERMEKADPRSGPPGWDPQIVIATENVQIDEVYCKRHYDARPGEYVCLSISDNGGGIDEEVRHRIFEPFFTTKEVGRGTGLGLAAVYGILKQHEGWIDLSSMKNMGTTFKSYLPRTRRPAIPIPQSVSVKRIAHGSETLLFVDDEASIRLLGQTILEHHGYTVLLAKNGEEALEVFQREHDRIKLVVLDLTMPRLSGREVLKQLLRLDPKMRVLISSGHHMADDSSELQNLGAVEFVPKPYRPDDLARSVRKLLDAAASPQRQAS